MVVSSKVLDLSASPLSMALMSAIAGWAMSPSLQRCAEPRAAGHSAEPQNRRALARPDQVGPDPYWCQDPKGGRKPINAKAESIARLPMFRDAYALRRCIVPVDGFFEWRAIRGHARSSPTPLP